MPGLDTDQLNTWNARLAQSIGEQAKHHQRWRDSLDFLRLSWFDKNLGGQLTERTEVHWAWSFYNTIIPTLYSRDPHIYVKPRRTSSVGFAETMEEVQNYNVDELKLKDSIQRAIGDAVAYGIGWIECGYQPTEPERKELEQKRKPSILEQVRASVNQALRPQEEEEFLAQGQLLPERKEGKVYNRWLPAWSVLLAPGYHLIRQMPYLITMEDIEMEELENDTSLDSAIVRQVKPTRQVGGKQAGSTSTPMPRRIGSMSLSGGGPPANFARIYTVWDRRNRQVFKLADGVHDSLHWMRWPSSFDEFPQIPLIFNDTPPSEDDSYAYPMDDITPLKHLLLELSLSRTSMIKARRRLAPFIVVDADLHQEDDIRKLQESEEFVVIPIRGGTAGVTPITLKIPDDIFRVNDIILNDLYTTSGFSQLLLAGQSPKGTNTATEANLGQAGTNLRGARKTDIIEDFVIEVARRNAANSWEFMDRDAVSELLDKPVSMEMWPDLPDSKAERQRVINKELSFRIDANSTQPEQIKMIEQNIAIRNTNMMMAAFPGIFDMTKMAKYHMKKIGDKDFEHTLKPEEEPSQQEAEQENQLMMQGNFQLAHKGDRHDIHIPVHGQAALTAQGQGMDSTALDKHILMHAQLQQLEQPGAGKGPQKGDISSPNQAAVPELQREGGENMADLLGQGASTSQGLGPETSMAG